MKNTTKHSEIRFALTFTGLRWNEAQAEMGALRSIAARSFGSASDHVGFVDISVASGKPREWEASPSDGSWRTLAELDLADPAGCADFVQRRGDPTGELRPGQPIHSVQWLMLSEALRIAAEAWLPADASGTSFLNPDRAVVEDAAERLLSSPYVTSHTKQLTTSAMPGIGRLLIRPKNLAAYLVMRAAATLDSDNPAAMRRCACCSFWFETRRVKSQPRFCSASCRALNHQNRENPEWRQSARASRSKGHHAVAERCGRSRRRAERRSDEQKTSQAKRKRAPTRSARSRKSSAAASATRKNIVLNAI